MTSVPQAIERVRADVAKGLNPYPREVRILLTQYDAAVEALRAVSEAIEDQDECAAQAIIRTFLTNQGEKAPCLHFSKTHGGGRCLSCGVALLSSKDCDGGRQ